jgi:hypothetical protein
MRAVLLLARKLPWLWECCQSVNISSASKLSNGSTRSSTAKMHLERLDLLQLLLCRLERRHRCHLASRPAHYADASLGRRGPDGGCC